jgi:hypothetical protein
VLSSRFGSSQIHSASFLPVPSAFNSAFKGKSRKLTSSTAPVLNIPCCSYSEPGVSFLFCCPRFLLPPSEPPSRESLTNWVTWCPPLPLRSKPVSIYLLSLCSITLTHLFPLIAAGEHSRTTIQTSTGPEDVPNYALVQGIFIGVVAAYLLFFTLIGPENHGSHFERGKTAFQAGASQEDLSSAPRNAERSSLGSGDIRQVENGRQGSFA